MSSRGDRWARKVARGRCIECDAKIEKDCESSLACKLCFEDEGDDAKSDTSKLMSEIRLLSARRAVAPRRLKERIARRLARKRRMLLSAHAVTSASISVEVAAAVIGSLALRDDVKDEVVISSCRAHLAAVAARNLAQRERDEMVAEEATRALRERILFGIVP